MQKRQIMLFIVGNLLIATACSGFFIKTAVADEEWTDPKDDLYSLSAFDVLEMMATFDFESAPTPSQFQTLTEAMMEQGKQVATPDCVDIISVKINIGDENTTLRVKTEADISECSTSTALYGFLNDSSDAGVGLRIEYGDPSSFGYTDYEDDDANETTATGSISGDSMTIEYPNSVYQYNSDSQLLLMLMGMEGDYDDPTSLTFVFDIFPNSLTGDFDRGLYDGGEPITEFIDDVANLLFFWMPPESAFTMFLICIALIGKVLIDRKMIYLRVSGGVLLGLLLYPEIFYMLDINLAGGIGSMIIGSMSLVSLVSLMMFSLFQFTNNFGMTDDNAWALFLPESLMIFSGFLYMTPFFSSSNAIISIITSILFLFGTLVVMFFTEKYSKGRLK